MIKSHYNIYQNGLLVAQILKRKVWNANQLPVSVYLTDETVKNKIFPVYTLVILNSNSHLVWFHDLFTIDEVRHSLSGFYSLDSLSYKLQNRQGKSS